MPIPDQTLELARQQLGLLTRRQLVAAIGQVAADHAVASQRFERVQRGVYLIRGSAPHPCQPAVAATLRAGDGAVLTGPAALRLMDLEGIHLGEGFAVALPAGRRLRDLGVPLLRRRDPARATWRLGQIEVAAPTDALIESCLLEPPPAPRALRLAHDRLRWTGRLQPGVLHERVTRLRVPVDAPHVRALLHLDGQRATGDGERGLGQLLTRFDPPPEPQVWVTPHRCIDWYFRSLQVGVEYQGVVDHDGAAGRRRDRARDDELSMVGVRLLYVTAADLDDDRSLLARVAAALTVRADELGKAAPTLLAAA
ncbi:MAG: type IV toxin-antitoxin system AbiEi family antitoxin domain-containing protein [Nitriliruptoraceae bacterium]